MIAEVMGGKTFVAVSRELLQSSARHRTCPPGTQYLARKAPALHRGSQYGIDNVDCRYYTLERTLTLVKVYTVGINPRCAQLVTLTVNRVLIYRNRTVVVMQ